MDSVQQNEIDKSKMEEQCKLEHVRLCNQLSIEQFKNLRSQIDAVLRETRSIELYALGGVITYYAWLFTHCIPSTVILVPIFGFEIPSRLIPWFIPVMLPVLGAWRVRANVWGILICAEYIAEIENEFGKEDKFGKTPCHIGPHKGWENYLRGNRIKRMRSKNNTVIDEDKICEDEYEAWDKMPRWKRVWIVGKISHYWPFWIFLTVLTVFVFIVSFSIGEPLSQQTCSASSTPVVEKSGASGSTPALAGE